MGVTGRACAPDVGALEDFPLVSAQALRASIDKKIQNELTGDVAKYVSSEQLTDMVMKRLTNEDGNVYLKYNVTGTTTSPKPTLVEPTVPSLQALMKEMGVNVADIAKEAAKKEAEKAIDDATNQVVAALFRQHVIRPAPRPVQPSSVRLPDG
mgnify:CR=1 FL=1